METSSLNRAKPRGKKKNEKRETEGSDDFAYFPTAELPCLDTGAGTGMVFRTSLAALRRAGAVN